MILRELIDVSYTKMRIMYGANENDEIVINPKGGTWKVLKDEFLNRSVAIITVHSGEIYVRLD